MRRAAVVLVLLLSVFAFGSPASAQTPSPAPPSTGIDPACVSQNPGFCVQTDKNGQTLPGAPMPTNNAPPIGESGDAIYNVIGWVTIGAFVVVGMLIGYGWLRSRRRGQGPLP